MSICGLDAWLELGEEGWASQEAQEEDLVWLLCTETKNLDKVIQ